MSLNTVTLSSYFKYFIQVFFFQKYLEYAFELVLKKYSNILTQVGTLQECQDLIIYFIDKLIFTNESTFLRNVQIVRHWSLDLSIS